MVSNDCLFVGQYAHIDEIEMMITSAVKLNQTEFWSHHWKLPCKIQAQQTLYAYPAALISQVKPYQAGFNDVLVIYKQVRALKSITMQKLMYPKLYMGSDAIHVYTDAGHNTNAYITSHLGVIVLLVDKNILCNVPHWSSKNCTRYMKSMISAETYAFADGYDIDISFKNTWKTLFLMKLSSFVLSIR